jgi:hypothetical protein
VGPESACPASFIASGVQNPSNTKISGNKAMRGRNPYSDGSNAVSMLKLLKFIGMFLVAILILMEAVP